MFACSECGECCRNLDKSPLYNELHAGDGICKNLVGNLCGIYEKRPLLCRIDESYIVFFRKNMTYSEYCNFNYECCETFKNKI